MLLIFLIKGFDYSFLVSFQGVTTRTGTRMKWQKRQIKIIHVLECMEIQSADSFFLISYSLLAVIRSNTRVYNLISVPEITRFLLGEAIISSITDSRSSGSKKGKRSHGKVRNNKRMWTILKFILILYPKQQSNILRCFSSLKFQKSLFSNTFFSFIFHIKMIDT